MQQQHVDSAADKPHNSEGASPQEQATDVAPLKPTLLSSDRHLPSTQRRAVAQNLATFVGNSSFIRRFVQRQPAAPSSTPPINTAPPQPHTTAPPLWTYEQFAEYMHRDQSMVGRWWEDNITGYDEELFKIGELLKAYHTAAASDQPESKRLEQLVNSARQLESKSTTWIANNPDSYRLDEMTIFWQQVKQAVAILNSAALPYLGDKVYEGSLSDLTYIELRALDWHIQDLLATTEDPTDKAALESTLAEVRAAVLVAVEKIFATFPSEILSNPSFGMPKTSEERVQFLEFIAAYLGSIDNAISNYSSVRRANVPGEVWLVDAAATRLEQVQAAVGGFEKMPKSWVALAIRGRTQAHTRTANGLMAHPLGYALDYYPLENVMLTGARFDLANLDARMQSGNEDERITMDLGSSKERRDLIERMGNGTATPEEIAKFEEELAKEFERVSELSDNFGSVLGEDAIERLETQKANLAANHTNATKNAKEMGATQAKIDKLAKKKELSAAEQAELESLTATYQELQARHAELQQEHYLIWQEIQDVFAPYIQQIEAEQAALGEDVEQKALALLGEGVGKLNQLQTSLQADLESIMAGEASNKDETLQKAYADFFTSYKATYSTLATDVQPILLSESKSNKSHSRAIKAAVAKLSGYITTMQSLSQRFEAAKPPAKEAPVETNPPAENPVETNPPRAQPPVEANAEPISSEEAPPMSAEMRLVLVAAKPAIFDFYQQVLSMRQLHENYKLNTGSWKGSDLQAWQELQQLKISLMWDDVFIFSGAGNAKDPGVLQTLKAGFFNPEETTEDGKTEQAGFTLEFLKAMAEHGFDLAVAWETVTDAMHFELVQAVDALPPAKPVTEELARSKEDLIKRGIIKDPNAKK